MSAETHDKALAFLGAFKLAIEAERQAQAMYSGLIEFTGFCSPPSDQARSRSASISVMNALIAHIERRKLTQVQAARLLGVTQPRVSNLMAGKIHLFSIDTLVNLLAAAGLRVALRVSKAA